MKITIPITARTNEEALKDMDVAKRFADIIELRLDYMDDPNLESLINHSQIPKIVTNRTKYEGGRFAGSEKSRIRYLQEAIDLGAEYVDIELDHYSPLTKGRTKLIVSHHNFEETPKDLVRIYNRIAEKDPDIVKIATKANNYEDSLRMLDLIRNADKDVIGVCMGQHGIITRVLGPVLGGYLTFASLGEGKSSAPGQLNVNELKDAWKLLQLENK